MIESYCVKERRRTDCVPGTEELVMMRNRREALRCVCASCGIKKYTIIPTRMGEYNWDDFVGDRQDSVDTYEDWKGDRDKYRVFLKESLFKRPNPTKIAKQLEKLTGKPSGLDVKSVIKRRRKTGKDDFSDMLRGETRDANRRFRELMRKPRTRTRDDQIWERISRDSRFMKNLRKNLNSSRFRELMRK